jgi:hypothetical protein
MARRHVGSAGTAPIFLTSALDGGEWSPSQTGRLTPPPVFSSALSIPFSSLSTYLFFFFIYNLNQQSEFTFYRLMWLLQCLDGESSSGESPVPQIRSIGQFLLSRLFSSLNNSVLRSGFSYKKLRGLSLRAKGNSHHTNISFHFNFRLIVRSGSSSAGHHSF